MKTMDEILSCGRMAMIEKGPDGFSAIIYMGNFEGSVIDSWGAGWDHVSISPRRKSYTPSWSDMCRLKDIFFRDDEAVIQIHPPKDEYVNNMPNCLHLWRANDKEMVLPPSFMVGLKKGQTMDELKKETERYYNEHGYNW